MNQRDQLRVAFEAADADSRVRVIVLRASGEHFSSGGEIQGFLDASPEHVSQLAWNIAAPARCKKPVIAASRGYCFGVAFELALRLRLPPGHRKFRIRAARAAARHDPGLGRRGPPAEDGRHHPRQGHRHALAPHYRLPRAFEWGIATECVNDAELEKATDALVDELRSFAPLAQRTAKKLMNDLDDATLSLGIELEGQAYGRLRGSDDFREGVEAFHAKRKPNFKGR